MKIIATMVVFVMLLPLLTGCGTESESVGSINHEPPTVSDANMTTETSKTEVPDIQSVPSPSAEGWREGYIDVLLNNAEYFSTDLKKNMTLSQNNAEFDESAFIKKLTVMDLDKDGIPEVVLWRFISEDSNEGFEVLRYEDNAVFGYTLYYRQCFELKADGTFAYSSSGYNHGFGTLSFSEDMWSIDKISYCETTYGDDGTPNETLCFVNGLSATEDELTAAYNEQHGKSDAIWYDFTDSQIESLLTPNESATPSQTSEATPNLPATPMPSATTNEASKKAQEPDKAFELADSIWDMVSVDDPFYGETLSVSEYAYYNDSYGQEICFHTFRKIINSKLLEIPC